MQRKYRRDPLAYLPTERRASIYTIINTVSKHLDWPNLILFFLNNVRRHHRILSLWDGEDRAPRAWDARWDLVSLLAVSPRATLAGPIPHAENAGHAGLPA